MKKIAALLAGLLSLPICAFAEDVTLNMSSWLPPLHPLTTHVLKPWTKQVEEATKGRVTFRILPKVVGTPAAQVDVVRDGMADVGFIAHSYAPGRFVRQQFVDLPFLGDNAAVLSRAYWRMYVKHLAKYNEHEGVLVLSVMTATPGELHNSRKDIVKLSDMAGMKIRSPGDSTADLITMMGAVPVSKPISETYELLSTKVVDGTLGPLSTVTSNKLQGLVTHTTIMPGGFYNVGYSLFINPAKWARISPADQEAIKAVSGEKFAELWGNVMDEADVVAVKDLKSAGNTITKASPALVEEVKKATSPFEARWVAEAKQRGLTNAEQVLKEFRAEVESLSSGKP